MPDGKKGRRDPRVPSDPITAAVRDTIPGVAPRDTARAFPREVLSEWQNTPLYQDTIFKALGRPFAGIQTPEKVPITRYADGTSTFTIGDYDTKRDRVRMYNVEMPADYITQAVVHELAHKLEGDAYIKQELHPYGYLRNSLNTAPAESRAEALGKGLQALRLMNTGMPKDSAYWFVTRYDNQPSGDTNVARVMQQYTQVNPRVLDAAIRWWRDQLKEK